MECYADNFRDFAVTEVFVALVVFFLDEPQPGKFSEDASRLDQLQYCR